MPQPDVDLVPVDHDPFSAEGMIQQANTQLASQSDRNRWPVQDVGAPAIPDGGQLSPGTNYVVFNDKIVDILRKYGLAGLSALPPALQAAAHQQLTPVDHDPFANGS